MGVYHPYRFANVPNTAFASTATVITNAVSATVMTANRTFRVRINCFFMQNSPSSA
jgi:hypothetical protein